MPKPTHDVAIGPGDGVYIPPYRPHWLSNGDDVSLSLTLTFFNPQNETESLVQVFNARLRRLGLSPRREGESAVRDAAKARFMRGYAAVRRRASLPKPAAR
jgi:oxalate decarboxylase/phosphoglucose isomerase-like protein (cupin superfamily)